MTALMDRLLGGEHRSLAPRRLSTLVDLLGGGASYSGKTVSATTALGLVPVYSAVSLIAGAVGSLPLLVYRRRADGGRERATDHWTWRLLHEQPNELQAADEFWELVTAHLLLWGNAYAAKGRDGAGRVNELVPLDPSKVSVRDRDDGRLSYEYGGRKIAPGGLLHFRGPGVNGRQGLSPIHLARQTLGNAMAQEEFAGRLWANNARPGGVLKHPGEMSDKAQRRLRATWDVTQGGLANAGKTAILEEGMEWQSLSLPLQDAQFIEQARFSREEIALLFRVPPHMLGASAGDSLTYSTVEGQATDFARFTLRRWLVRLEGTLKRDPDLFVQGQRFYPEFLVDAMLRAESKTRANVYRLALDRETGWLTRDEVRALENRNPLTDDERAEFTPRRKDNTDG